jgi:Tfp pilus assembly protein PilX
MKTGRQNRLRDSKGASLIAAVFLILVLSFLGWVMVSMSSLSSRESVNELYSARAWYDACSAAEVEIVLLDRGVVTAAGQTHYQFEQGTAEVDARLEAADYWLLTITAVNGSAGSADYARRRLLVKFKK